MNSFSNNECRVLNESFYILSNYIKHFFVDLTNWEIAKIPNIIRKNLKIT